jgi:UDP-glucose 4-epimerase
MKYLITGIAGFVGSSLARAILAQDNNAVITGIDNFSFGYYDRVNDLVDRIELVVGDLVEINQLIPGRCFDIIVHCAAIAPLPECQINSYRALTQNVAVCGSVVDYALISGSRNIIFFSSAAIYEGCDQYPTSEYVSIAPRLVYPTSKYIAEQYLAAMCRSHEINVTAIRLFNLYGPQQDYFRKQPPLIGYLIRSLVLDEQAILFSTGTQCRDYVYIDDLLDFILISARKMKRRENGGSFLAVNVGSGVPISVNQIISELEQVSGKQLKIQRRPAGQYWDKYPDLYARKIGLDAKIVEQEVNKHTQAATDKCFQEFGWAATTSLKKGLSICFSHGQRVLLNKSL